MAKHSLVLLILLSASTRVRAEAPVDVGRLIKARDFTSLEVHFGQCSQVSNKAVAKGENDMKAHLSGNLTFILRKSDIV